MITKRIYMLPVFLIMISALCKAQSIKSNCIQRNIAADKGFLKALRTGEVNDLEGVISPDFYNHTGEHRGLDSLKSAISQFHLRMKPVGMDLIRQIADEAYVADWVRYNFSNQKFKIEGIEMTRYQDGKAVEHWFFSYKLPQNQ